MHDVLSELTKNLFVSGKITLAFFAGIFFLALFLGSTAINFGWRREEKAHKKNPKERGNRPKIDFL